MRSEKERRKIAWDLENALRRADLESYLAYAKLWNWVAELPESGQRKDEYLNEIRRLQMASAVLLDKLLLKYRGEVMKAYHLTPRDASEIQMEAIRKDWPLPPPLKYPKRK